PLLQVDDLRVYYASTGGDYRVVDGSSLTVYRNELFGLAGESGSGKSTLVEGILRLVKPPGYIPTGRVLFSLPRNGGWHTAELSGGMKQRAIIAAAVALNPQLVIADEPTTALDVNVQRVVIETLAQLRRDLGVAIIMVSHDLPVHAQLVDRMAIMYAGRVVEV